MRLDQFVAGRVKNIDVSEASRLAGADQLLVNGKPGSAEDLLKPGDEIVILSPYSSSAEISPVNIPLDIVFENDHSLVINKPAGLVLHPGLGNYNNSLLHALAWYYRENKITAISNGLVHRLDKETSGLLVVAKTKEAFSSLSLQFKTREAGRTYNALVWGHMPAQSGVINVPVGRDPQDQNIIRAFNDGKGGKPAITHYTVLETYKNASLVECRLQTGRTHQLRIHLTHLGNPIIGDKRYGANHSLPEGIISRQALHAGVLSFADPGNGEKLSFSVPPPPDFSRLIVHLRSL